ncbi:hypothetical protein ACINKY_24960 [Paenibacillus illinoisensis]|uniref:Uncharacterized protein n=1 Tax=Paenibacillus illinoisensis TaxID=59845 RepID=A0ABW8I184_9BACL
MRETNGEKRPLAFTGHAGRLFYLERKMIQPSSGIHWRRFMLSARDTK